MITITELTATMHTGNVPFRFNVGDEPAVLEFRHERVVECDDRTISTLAYSCANAPITVILECTEISEWKLCTYRFRLKADRSVYSRINDVRIFDLTLLHHGEASLRGWNGGWVYHDTGIHHNKGMFPLPEYRMWDKDLTQERELMWEELEGRSSIQLLPIWFLYQPDCALWFGPEWSGSWRLQVESDDDTVRASLSLPFLDFVMAQGEEVQLPAVSVGTYSGGIGDACVQLRRIIYHEFMPTISGSKPEPMVNYTVIGGSIPKFDAEGLRKETDLAAELGIENIIFASPWFREPNGDPSAFTAEQLAEYLPHFRDKRSYEIGNWWEQCGDFIPNKTRFPNGLKAFADEINAKGIGLGLWYDPRINTLTAAHETCRDFLIPYKHSSSEDNVWDMGYIDLGVEEGRKFLFSLLEKWIVEFGATYLWHDLNTEPRPRYWDYYEEEDRRGLKELRHYIGSDMMYDELLAKHPHVAIEWCGGGGSMLNLGVFRRAHTLHIADYSEICGSAPEDVHTDGVRCYRTSLNWILPAGYISNPIKINSGIYEHCDGIGMHNFLTQMGSAFDFGIIISNWSRKDLDDAREAVAVFKQIRHYLHKDFWGLFPLPKDRNAWDGWQFHDPDTQSGLLFFFKLRDSEADTQTVKPNWTEGTMMIEPVLGKADIVQDGQQLIVSMPGKGALLRYSLA